MINLKKILAVIAFLLGNLLHAQNSQETINTLKTQTGATVTINENHNIAKFVKFPFDRPLSLQGNSLQDKVNNFLNQYKSIYNLTSISNSLEFIEVKTDNYGLKNLTLKQRHKGVPVFDAELRFHFNSEDKLTAINGNFIPFIKIDSTPSLSNFDANSIALETIENQNINHSGKELIIFSNKLFVFQKGLIQGYNSGNFLVYEVEVRNEFDVREFLYIDAYTGSLVEQFTGMAHSIDRILYEGNSSTTIWTEGDAFPGALDQWQQNEVETSGHMYNFFNNAFGYVSYDGADAQMRTINNDPGISCPNANWNGSTANYCTGTATDDIVGHEWGHAYTQFTSGLIYAWQSGAMNESYSDIWGETIDLLNGYEDDGEDLSLRTGCDSSDRWQQGEDATAFGGSIRDMWDPTCKGDPGKVTDNEYWCSTGDNGGVHINSGIPNHAYALLVDGGTYNGQTISAIGFTKAAHIFWRAQSVYLTATSNFSSLADALEASCVDLFGVNLEGLSTSATPAGLSGEILSSHDLTQVTNAILAVELRINPDTCNFTPLLVSSDELCGASTSNPLFYEDWESGIGDWTVEQLPTNATTWTSRDWVITSSLPNSRTGQAIFAIDPINGDCDSDLENGIIRLQSPVITIPDITTGIFELSFNHYVATEPSWDGGNLKYSLDGGVWNNVRPNTFSVNSYNGSLQTTAAGNDNPLAGQGAFTGADGGSNSGSWGQSTLDLSTINIEANSTIQFRWELGTDGCNGSVGWYVDEIILYNCSASLSVNKFDQMLVGVEIYPNPTNGLITVQKTNEINLVSAKIYDINGRLLKDIDLSEMNLEKQIDISKLASGIYIISVKSDNSSGVMRLIKQ
ncbi:MAG: bacillolysin [Flavobacteriales bacterium]|jgi:bacillolysin|tara:strand:- start:417 stop:2978 length:2562 start_codon:yes stop_codon:yes gene_type:complete